MTTNVCIPIFMVLIRFRVSGQTLQCWGTSYIEWNLYNLQVWSHVELMSSGFKDLIFNRSMMIPQYGSINCLINRSTWAQDAFISRVTKSLQKTSKLSKRKKRGWYTKEQMASTLGWSTSLNSINKLCYLFSVFFVFSASHSHHLSRLDIPLSSLCCQWGPT